MNTSTNTNQTQDTATSAVRAKGFGFLRRAMAGALLASAITATAAGLAAAARADAGAPFGGPAQVGVNCKTEPWGFLGSQRRTLCDGPISSDGSWSRQRTIWVPAHYSPQFCTSRSGSDRYSSSYNDCTGGYFTNERLVSDETYPVRPETVLHDEPGHLGSPE